MAAIFLCTRTHTGHFLFTRCHTRHTFWGYTAHQAPQFHMWAMIGTTSISYYPGTMLSSSILSNFLSIALWIIYMCYGFENSALKVCVAELYLVLRQFGHCQYMHASSEVVGWLTPSAAVQAWGQRVVNPIDDWYTAVSFFFSSCSASYEGRGWLIP